MEADFGGERHQRSGGAKLPELTEAIEAKKPQNAYQVQGYACERLFHLEDDHVLLPHLQQGAFNSGADVDAALLVSAIYPRDLVLPKFNFFRLEDLQDQ